MNRIVLVDAYAQIYRCYYAIRAGLTNAEGMPTNALFGIARFLLQLEQQLPSTHGAVVFDKGKTLRRIAICPEYKAQRPPMPEDMRPQIPRIREWFQAFGWPLLEQEGLEADDIIAAITRRRGELPAVIVTHDKDITQLTEDPEVAITYPLKGDSWATLHAADVEQKYGVPPSRLRDYLALVGDTADNIQGIPGVGPKRAAKMLQDFGDIGQILAHAEEAGGPRLGPVLQQSRVLLLRNQQLTTLDDQLPEGYSGLPVRSTPSWSKIREMAEREGFHSLLVLIDRLQKNSLQPELF